MRLRRHHRSRLQFHSFAGINRHLRPSGPLSLQHHHSFRRSKKIVRERFYELISRFHSQKRREVYFVPTIDDSSTISLNDLLDC